MKTSFEQKTQQPSPAQPCFHQKGRFVDDGPANSADQNGFFMSKDVAYTVLNALAVGPVPVTLVSDFTPQTAAILTAWLSLAAAALFLNFNRPHPQLREKFIGL
ncbi:hypothetical protein [Actibacterium sp. 188UL27-1]|uniref:hypothetical protein n=1 Tax=Actibacterium sp. 188UL27-1 TaxID=2786961 RepID=UPI00195A1695|nr:hypothetical protein [Actibacterium sp. 188UL27-1]MBM7066442.1 hypothetical protein [Actibacterium sp. 188UL27-1]